MPQINRERWRDSLTAKQLADRFGVEEVSIYSYARRHGLTYRAAPVGKPKQPLSMPNLPKHRRIIKLYRDGERNVRVIADDVRMTYHAAYRVVQRYLAYKAQQQEVKV